jgi:hypothetical protein
VDGLPVPDLGPDHTAVVDGDAKSFTIACASIVAKTTRDRLMRRLALRYPGYGWETNVGYGTPEHVAALGQLGPTPHHRRSFVPCNSPSGSAEAVPCIPSICRTCGPAGWCRLAGRHCHHLLRGLRFIMLGLMGEGAERDTAWAITAVAVGFLVGGWFTGYGTLEAPILHGVALGLMSLVAWVALNLVMVIGLPGRRVGGADGVRHGPVILTQIVAAVVGCWVGVRAAGSGHRGAEPGPGARGVRERRRG